MKVRVDEHCWHRPRQNDPYGGLVNEHCCRCGGYFHSLGPYAECPNKNIRKCVEPEPDEPKANTIRYTRIRHDEIEFLGMDRCWHCDHLVSLHGEYDASYYCPVNKCECQETIA
jgi:hypothetical protein